MALKKNRKGTTLVELMIVVAILAVIFMVGPQILSNVFKLWKTNEARVDIQKDARICLQLIQNLLREASASTIEISRQNTTDPPYSKISFTVPDGDLYEFYQQGNDLMILHQAPNGGPLHNRILAKNLRFISFGFPQITEDTLLSVALCFEKSTFADERKDYYLSSQRVQVRNL